jgi:drug/metabolite transporter (DMT)-like permease
LIDENFRAALPDEPISVTASGAGWGDAWMQASVICFAAGGAMVQRFSAGLSAIQVSWFVHVVGTALLPVHTGFAAPTALDALRREQADTWGLILFSGIGATALAALAWNRAIARIGIARTATAIYWVPVFGLAFAVLILGEPVTVWHLVSLGAVIAGSRWAPKPFSV